MDKLKRYNQKLLAILGTLALVTVALLLLTLIGTAIIPLFADQGNYEGRGHVYVEEAKPVEEKQSNEATFAKPIPLDTSTARFIIPVGQVQVMQENEETDDFSLTSLKRSWKGNYRGQNGAYNNFIFQDHTRGVDKALFNTKSHLSNWRYLKTEDTEVLLFSGTQLDSDSNGVLNGYDAQSLFVYYLEDQKLETYFFPDKSSVYAYDYLPQTNSIYVQLITDRNNDQRFNAYEEPKRLMVLNLTTRKIAELISESIQRQVQSILD